jgi:1,2-diacylglycerol 3-alpha-glucosyltransferase
VINQARELAKQGHKVSIFKPRARQKTNESIDLPKSVKIYDIPWVIPIPWLPNLVIAFPSLISSVRLLRKIKPDIIHVHTFGGCGWEGALATRLLSIPSVCTFHGFFAEPGYMKCFGLPNWKIMHFLLWKYSVAFHNRFDEVISPSQAVKKALMNGGVKTTPIVISNGIYQLSLPTPKEIAKLRSRYNIKGPSFIFTGRISAEKSPEILIKAFRKVVDKHPKAKLVLAGDGTSMGAVKQQINELKLRENVLLLGYVPNKKLISENMLLLGDVFVTASKTENQPLSIHEAMTFGLPIIGPKAKGIPEMIIDGDNGFLFPPDNVKKLAECMLRIADDKQLLRRMAKRSKDYSSKDTLSSSIEKVVKLYREVIIRKEGQAGGSSG